MQKESARIAKISEEDVGKKLIMEKLAIEKKLSKLETLNKKFVKKPILNKKTNL